MAARPRTLAATLSDRLADSRSRVFVGRTAELTLFRSALEADVAPFAVLHVEGPAGIGKTSLLDVLADVADAAGAVVVRIEEHDAASPAELSERLAPWLRGGITDRPGPDAGRLVLLVDGFERMGTSHRWLTCDLLPRLPASTVTVVASRYPPPTQWRTDPAWRDLLRDVSLRHLDPQEVGAFLAAAGVDQVWHDRLLRASHGHPLGLALMADLVARGGDPGPELPPDLVATLLERLVDTVPDRRRRRTLATCAIARTTTEPLLRHVLGTDDAHDDFRWLRSLSFVRSSPEGLVPHDLARDALEADLRWRDPQTHREVLRGVHAAAMARLRRTTGRDQQAAVFDLKFPFRRLRGALAPVEWTSWGEHYPDRVQSSDREAVLDLVRSWEGEESVRLVDRWLCAQPDGFWVLRGEGRSISGVLALVDLTDAPSELRDTDPGARAAWGYAQRTAPPRPGERLTMCRFVIDRQAYQGPSATLNATPVLTLQRQLCTRHLAWDFLALAEPDRWDEYFRVAGLPRCSGADFVVGGRTFGLFGHDFRAVPVEAWTASWVERAVAAEPASVGTRTAGESVVLSQPEFEAAARQALHDLTRPDLLARNPLLRARVALDEARPGRPDGRTLERLLHSALAALAQDPRDDRLRRAVDRAFVRPTGTREGAAAALGLPYSTYRRHLAQGVARVVAYLWDRELYGPPPDPGQPPGRG